jgi:hypothetical protein
MLSTHIIEVVASGTRERIEYWAELLRKGGISFEVRGSFDDHRSTRRNYAELWVDRDHAAAARSIICRDPVADGSMLW